MRIHPLADVIFIHLIRFGIMALTLEVAIFFGVSGWYLGLVANVAVTVFAVALVTRRCLWSRIGITRLWHSWPAALALLLLTLEAMSWAIPAGLQWQAPGVWLWILTLLLAAANEELISRGVVLSRLADAYRPIWAVTFTAALFGLQHLSAFALTSREAADILGNVALSAVYGFALAAFQLRFRWIWPLIVVHGLANFNTLHAAEPLSDTLIGVSHILLLGFGIRLLYPRKRQRNLNPRSAH